MGFPVLALAWIRLSSSTRARRCTNSAHSAWRATWAVWTCPRVGHLFQKHNGDCEARAKMRENKGVGTPPGKGGGVLHPLRQRGNIRLLLSEGGNVEASAQHKLKTLINPSRGRR